MPALVTRTHEKSGCGDGTPNCALVDQLAASLVRPTQKGIRRASHAQPAISRAVQQGAGFLRSIREGSLMKSCRLDAEAPST